MRKGKVAFAVCLLALLSAFSIIRFNKPTKLAVVIMQSDRGGHTIYFEVYSNKDLYVWTTDNRKDMADTYYTDLKRNIKALKSGTAKLADDDFEKLLSLIQTIKEEGVLQGSSFGTPRIEIVIDDVYIVARFPMTPLIEEPYIRGDHVDKNFNALMVLLLTNIPILA